MKNIKIFLKKFSSFTVEKKSLYVVAWESFRNAKTDTVSLVVKNNTKVWSLMASRLF